MVLPGHRRTEADSLMSHKTRSRSWGYTSEFPRASCCMWCPRTGSGETLGLSKECFHLKITGRWCWSSWGRQPIYHWKGLVYWTKLCQASTGSWGTLCTSRWRGVEREVTDLMMLTSLYWRGSQARRWSLQESLSHMATANTPDLNTVNLTPPHIMKLHRYCPDQSRWERGPSRHQEAHCPSHSQQ